MKVNLGAAFFENVTPMYAIYTNCLFTVTWLSAYTVLIYDTNKFISETLVNFLILNVVT